MSHYLHEPFFKFLKWVRFTSYTRQIVLFFCDVFLITLAYFLAFWLRLDMVASHPLKDAYFNLFLKSTPLLLSCRFIFNWFTRLYGWSFAHAGLQDAGRFFLSIFAGSLAFIFINIMFAPYGLVPPRSVYIIESSLSLLFLGGLRFGPRYLYTLYRRRNSQGAQVNYSTPTLIYGAGDNGELLARELLRTIGHGYHLIGFIDDNPSKLHVLIYGLKVFGNINDLERLIKKYKIQKILIAIPNFSGAPLRHVIDVCAPFGVSYKIVPHYQRILENKPNFKNILENVTPESLINRSLVSFPKDLKAELYHGKTVIVTGAAGTIGAEICKQLASLGVQRLILFDINENGIFFTHADIQRLYPNIDLNIEIGSVQDSELIQHVMRKYRPDIAFHAAAHKHVPLMELCPVEAIKNNVLGTLYVAQAAADANVQTFLLISTDKAAEPANIMGATKRLAELVLRAIDAPHLRKRIVRFGNVLGSSGSLLQIIQRQIHRGGPVTITDPEMTRFFLTVEEAIGLVLITPDLMESDTFILEMGECVNIDKLVRQVIALTGLVPERDIEIVYTKKRPGEKLTEVLVNDDETLIPTKQTGIQGIQFVAPIALNIQSLTRDISILSKSNYYEESLQLLRKYVPNFLHISSV